METADGKSIRVLNCNYEYLLVEASGELPDKMELRIPGTETVMKCVKTGQKAGLYYLDNWKELLFAMRLNSYLPCWKQKKIKLVERGKQF